MISFDTLATVTVALFILVTVLFLVSENRRPQETLAWALAFIFAPGFGALAYVLFGRGRKAFSKQTTLLLQDLEGNARPLLEPLLARQDAAIARLKRGSTSRTRLLRLVERNSQSSLTTGNSVEVQQDAATFYPSLVRDMEAARHSIHLQYFTWAADEFTEKLKDIMAAKARSGVEIRLLYDAMGSRTSLSRAYVEDLRRAGVQVAPTSPLWRLHTISYRNHRKITVIDGAVGYTGGMNMGKEHLDGGKGFTSWRDTQVRIEGEGAAILQTVFMVDWYNAVRENLFSDPYFPEAAARAEGDGVPVQILVSGPDSRWAAIRQLYFTMISTARKRVRIQSPYLVLDPTVAEALTAAALAGVDVQVMLTERASGDPVPGWAGNTYAAEVADAGVRVFLYRKGYLHAKTISVDGETCSIGSANVDIRSFSINYELNAVLYDEERAARLEADFERDLEHCVEFHPDEYRGRNAAVRFRDSVARLFSPLL